jgi:hypothetical protein
VLAYFSGDEPWYIDPKTGKAPAYLQLTAFMASQLFVGLVMAILNPKPLNPKP